LGYSYALTCPYASSHFNSTANMKARNHMSALTGCCVLQVPIAVMVLLDPAVHSDTIYGHTQLSVLMCVISSGYFLHDLIIVLARLSTEGVAMLVHACCCLFVYTYAVYSFYLTFYGELW
jgi:hypothetical protein